MKEIFQLMGNAFYKILSIHYFPSVGMKHLVHYSWLPALIQLTLLRSVFLMQRRQFFGSSGRVPATGIEVMRIKMKIIFSIVQPIFLHWVTSPVPVLY